MTASKSNQSAYVVNKYSLPKMLNTMPKQQILSESEITYKNRYRSEDGGLT